MTAKVISIFDYLKGDKQEQVAAMARALERPMTIPTDEDLTPEYVADWLLRGLWLEGYKVERCMDDGDDIS